LTLDNDTVIGNHANAGDGGQGIGRGVYNLATLNLVERSILTNRATASNDDSYGEESTSLRAAERAARAPLHVPASGQGEDQE
jgi:hypothetical protein